jgi:uncharacterized membrane protein YtjA (UPF0391 family)
LLVVDFFGQFTPAFHVAIPEYSNKNKQLTKKRETHMLRWAAIFLVIAVIAALLGFTGVAGAAAEIARFLFFLFIAIFVIIFLLAVFTGRKML